MFRKTLAGIATVSGKFIGNAPQGYIVIVIIIAFFAITIFKKPFNTKTLTFSEALSLFVIASTVYLGLFLESAVPEDSACFDATKDCKVCLLHFR
jgi:hypothetical protein